MLTKEITSLQHPLIKHLVKLRENSRYRQEHKRVVILGKKMIFELARKIPIRTLLLSKDFSLPFSCDVKIQVNPAVMKKITNLEEPEGIAAEVDLPETKNFSFLGKTLVLDSLSDPGNLGTLLRTALALGWTGAVLTPNTVDPFNEKALRAAKGATFFLPLLFLSEEDLQKKIQEEKFFAYVADSKGKDVTTFSFKEKQSILLILSNESSGIKPWTKTLCEKISIPIEPSIESLNVSIAGSILMYAMKNL